MANMEAIIDEYLTANGIDESGKDSLVNLVNQCFTCYVEHMAKEWIVSKPTKATKPAKATKADKMDNPINAEKQDDLNRCTSQTLNEFCKNNGLKQGGNKKEIISRVWRLIQGEMLEDDQSPRSKTKKTPAKQEKHQCFGCNAKGAPCGSAASEEYEGHWFCWRHIADAQSIIESKQPQEAQDSDSPYSEHSDSERSESEHEEPEPEPVKTKKVARKKTTRKELSEESE